MKRIIVICFILGIMPAVCFAKDTLESPYFPPLPFQHWLTKAGPPDPSYDFEFKSGNTGKQNVYRGFDKDSNPQMMQKNTYSPAQHTHSIADVTDISKYKAPNASLADNAAKADSADVADAGQEAKTCGTATEAKKGTLVDEADFATIAENGLTNSDDTPQNAINIFDGISFKPAQEGLLPNSAKTLVTNGLLCTDDKGIYITRTIDDLTGEIKKQLSSLTGAQIWLIIIWSVIGIIEILSLIYFWWIPIEGSRTGNKVKFDFNTSEHPKGIYECTGRDGYKSTDAIHYKLIV